MISRFFLALCGYQARDGGEHEQATPSRLPIAAPVASPDLYDHLPAFLRLLGES